MGFFYEEKITKLSIMFSGDKMIEKLYKNGKKPIDYVKAVTKNSCNRCLGKNIYQDRYGKFHCLDCFQYGEINDTMTLYRFKRELKEKIHTLKMEYSLTDLQMKGSDFLFDCYLQNESGFLQAVCGAGKTEMTYHTILEALNKQAKVCFVIPRVEVLKEVSQRFKLAFPKTNISVIYEGNKHYEESEFLLSTPQQLIYFYHEFDLIILDEVDAFPYSGNAFLERLVKKAIKSAGIILYMSATISKDFEETLKSLRTYLIPSRFHKLPMVLPEFARIRNKASAFKKIIPYLNENKRSNKPTLIFIPTIATGTKLYEQLKLKGYKCGFLSSKTSYKHEIIKQFRNGDINFLITTTILERGVTFSNIDVFVMYSDHRVFNMQTLIQIAGRIGRDITYPNGLLIFFSEYLTKPMRQTKNEIIYMNYRNQEIEMQNL